MTIRPFIRSVGTLEAYFDDLIVNLPHEKPTMWEMTVDREMIRRKNYGNDSFLMKKYIESLDEELEDDELEEEPPELVYEKGREYSNWELEQLADQMLREDSKRELCRRCNEYGEETGHIESQPQFHPDGGPLVDSTGDQLYVDFPELQCKNGHIWYRGEGKRRGNDGPNPILFADHLKNRQKREIYTTIGTPDPKIVAGIFNRTHPQGRKVNSEDQRKRHGASFYR